VGRSKLTRCNPANLPISGSFYEYSVRFLSPQLGLTVGWIFVLTWITVVPFELTTICAQLKFWTDKVRPEWLIAPLLAVLSVVNFFGTKVFSKAETGLGVVKIAAVSVFIGMAIAIAAGGAPEDPRYGNTSVDIQGVWWT
jgi:yeast amino acid transporter